MKKIIEDSLSYKMSQDSNEVDTNFFLSCAHFMLNQLEKEEIRPTRYLTHNRMNGVKQETIFFQDIPFQYTIMGDLLSNIHEVRVSFEYEKDEET